MMDHDIYKQIFSYGEHATILTPNRRLSATLHKIYQHYQLEQQHPCWQTPDILPISSWIQRLWNDYTSTEFNTSPHLLNTAQEHFLWEKILLQSKQSGQLLQLSETADIAKSAWGLLKQWKVDIHHPIFNSAEDYAALRFWATQYQKICVENHWIDFATLPDEIIEKIHSKQIRPQQYLILVGFTEISPQLKHLFSTCEAIHSQVIRRDISQTQRDSHRLSLLDDENEILTIARWAKSILAKDDKASIGCVLPSLDKIRDRVSQIFSEVFANENSYTVDAQTSPFNISAGKNLLHYPIVNTALQLLSLHKKTVSSEILSYVLTSPFLGEAEVERIKRCLFDSSLRQANVNSVDLAAITAKDADKKSLSLANHCPHLARRLRKFISLLDEQQQSMSYREWADIFNQLLTSLGWPGERSLSSEEYQIVDSWLKLLEDYVTLDQITQPVNIHQALQTLNKMAKRAIFQPKTPEARIQVLGVLEAAAIPFDYLWVAGMDDLSWPPQPKPNPFIPKRLQRELHMPHATAERELMFCSMLIQQFMQSAKHVIFSHAEKNDELELQASSLIRDIPEITIEQLNLVSYQTRCEKIFATKNMEVIVDETAPPLIPNEKIRGGINVIKQQALCPFKSFSEWRLHAHELESPLPGLRPKDRGTIIHKTLELLWGSLKDHESLIAMQDHDLNELIHRCIDDALKATPNSRSEFTQYIALEKQRLYRLVSEWLNIEKSRTSFKVVFNEEVTQITLNQLNLSVRIDRIDELPDGKKLIIDYKTGKNNEINSWFSERPEEPQLPLYSLIDPDNTIGITFAQIATGDHCFKGVSRDALEIRGVKLITEVKKTTALSWDDQLSQWKSVLEKLSDDFYQGIAKVDPKEPTQTCTWCALKPFCRINEACDLEIDRLDK